MLGARAGGLVGRRMQKDLRERFLVPCIFMNMVPVCSSTLLLARQNSRKLSLEFRLQSTSFTNCVPTTGPVSKWQCGGKKHDFLR